jgi:hypothetical protein
LYLPDEWNRSFFLEFQYSRLLRLLEYPANLRVILLLVQPKSNNQSLRDVTNNEKQFLHTFQEPARRNNRDKPFGH